MLKKIEITIIISSFIMLILCAMNMAQTKSKSAASDKRNSMLEKKVLSIFEKKCSITDCHAGKFASFSLNLEQRKFKKALIDKPSMQIDTLKLVDTARPEKSYLLMKINGTKGIINGRMPIDEPLTKKEIAAIESWIKSLREISGKNDKK